MSTRFFHMEKRGFFMIGSIFPVCYGFRGISGFEERFIRRHTWKWVVGCVVVGLLAWWFVQSELASRAFDWGVFARAVRRLHWPWLLLSLIPIFGTYYG